MLPLEASLPLLVSALRVILNMKTQTKTSVIQKSFIQKNSVNSTLRILESVKGLN